MNKWLCWGSMAVGAVILVIYGLDLAVGVPFGRAGLVQDIMLALAGALVVWQAYETWKEIA